MSRLLYRLSHKAQSAKIRMYSSFKMPVELFTGPKHSGKTTRLAAWCAAQLPGTVGGILQPRRPGGRVLVDVLTGEETALEVPPDAPPTVPTQQVGRFMFAAGAFEWAAARLAHAAADLRVTTVVVDEIGPLELRGEGLDAAVRALVADARPAVRIVLVVREELADDVRKRYGT